MADILNHQLINTKFIVILFTIIIFASVSSLILYDQWEKQPIKILVEPRNSIIPTPFGYDGQVPYMEPRYIPDPDNPGEMILDIDSMLQVQKIFNRCETKQIAIDTNYTKPDGTKYALTNSLHIWQNSTHYIDSNECEWTEIVLQIQPRHLSFCGADGFTNGKLNENNSTHIWNENECEWQYRDTFGDLSYDEDFNDDFEIDYNDQFE